MTTGTNCQPDTAYVLGGLQHEYRLIKEAD